MDKDYVDKELLLDVDYHFDSAHKLTDYDGPCGNLHGHRWKVLVSAKGEIGDGNMVIDFTKIKSVIDELDHKYLNDILKEPNPTAEFISLYLLKRFETLYPKVKFKIKVFESPGASVQVESYEF